eukprot:13053289-Alexandrium_andersonii.AAC.1
MARARRSRAQAAAVSAWSPRWLVALRCPVLCCVVLSRCDRPESSGFRCTLGVWFGVDSWIVV